jgi:hypothetical protein
MITFTVPIPPGWTAAIVGQNVVFSQNVVPPPPPKPLSITTPVALPGATVGVTYVADLAALAKPQGGVPPYTFKARTGFPNWLVLTPSGMLTGRPAAVGNFTLLFDVVDSSGLVVTAAATHA